MSSQSIVSETSATPLPTLLYATSASFPSQLANRKQVLHQVTAFAHSGMLGRVILAVAQTDSTLENQGFSIVETRSRFLPKIVLAHVHTIRTAQVDYVYCREIRLGFLLLLAKQLGLLGRARLTFEVHVLRYPQRLDSLLLQMCSRYFYKVVTINSWMKAEIVRAGWVSPENVLSAHDAADPSVFRIDIAKTEARRILGLPEDAFIAVYTGRYRPLGMDKGLEAVIRAIPVVLKQQIPLRVYAVGGSAQEIELYGKLISDARVSDVMCLIPYTEQRYVALYHAAADALFLNLPGTSDFFRYYTSPLKLFEYLMAGRPVIASDLPSVRDVVDDTTSYIIRPDSIDDLAQALTRLAKDTKLRDRLGENARAISSIYTWDARARAILNFIH